MSEEGSKKRRLGDILLEKGIINQEQLKEALEEQKKSGRLLGELLISMGFASEKDILEALGVQTGTTVIDLSKMEIPDEVIKQVPASLAKVYNVIPIKFENDVLTVALSDPLNVN
ncbi:MAG TPA: type II secretion system protein GspE, partial [Candidatus Omnitrophica bacterium]|nr:type II secretion system protein GspE [Candidatus Omnitrophota bacterium]